MSNIRTIFDTNDIPANANTLARTKIIKDIIKKFKSPDIKKMHSIAVPKQKLTYYFSSKERLREKFNQLKKEYPEEKFIIHYNEKKK